MPLGNNRDYRTADKRARKGLATHFARMTELISQGMSKEKASKQALAEMMSKQRAKNAR